MKATFGIITLLCLGLSSAAQFYPNSNALWCAVDDVGIPPGFDVQFNMSNSPDTLIGGTVYKRVTESNNYFGSWMSVRNYYVRSDPSRKGYIFLLDSLAEYLTGDVSAQAGDTVHDVLIYAPQVDEYFQFDFLVDSVVLLSSGGVSVVRHFISGLLLPADISFWQAGMATSFGPIIRFHGTGYFCAVNNVSQYDITYNGPPPGGPLWGLPGGPISCLPISLGLNSANAVEPIDMGPNPSTGLFRFTNANGEKRIQDAGGREVLVTRENEVDLSAHPPGIYTAVVNTATGRQAVRLVVVR